MDYVDGPLFFDWLVTQRPSILLPDGRVNAAKLPNNAGRGIHRWRKEGARVDMNSYAFEEVMTALDLQEWEIPEEFERDRWKGNYGPKIGQKSHDKIVRLYAEGKSITEIAKATRISRTSVRRHIQQEVG
jgi:hypothetical protein